MWCWLSLLSRHCLIMMYLLLYSIRLHERKMERCQTISHVSLVATDHLKPPEKSLILWIQYIATHMFIGLFLHPYNLCFSPQPISIVTWHWWQDLRRCWTLTTAPCHWTICFLRNPLSTKCEDKEITPHHTLSFPHLSAEFMFSPLDCISQKATAPGDQAMAAGSATMSFSDSSHSGYAGGGRFSLHPIQYVVLWIRMNSFSLDLSKLLSIRPSEALLNLTVWLTDM